MVYCLSNKLRILGGTTNDIRNKRNDKRDGGKKEEKRRT